MGLYHLCNKNKGADQLCGNHAADLRLCFCINKKQIFHDTAILFFRQNMRSMPHLLIHVETTKVQISLGICTV